MEIYHGFDQDHRSYIAVAAWSILGGRAEGAFLAQHPVDTSRVHPRHSSRRVGYREEVKHRHTTAEQSAASASNRAKPWDLWLARLMDSQFRIPRTKIRFGLNPIIGVVPIIGDSATLLIGTTMIVEAIRLRLDVVVVLRMFWNLIVDWFAGLIPGVDLLLDTAVKSHSKNARLLQRAAKSVRARDLAETSNNINAKTKARCFDRQNA